MTFSFGAPTNHNPFIFGLGTDSSTSTASRASPGKYKEVVFHSITADPEYEHHSFEELRLQEYLADSQGRQPNKTSAISTTAWTTYQRTTPVLARFEAQLMDTGSDKKRSDKKRIEKSIRVFKLKKRKSDNMRNSLRKNLPQVIKEENNEDGENKLDRLNKNLESSLDGGYWAISDCRKKRRRLGRDNGKV